MKMLSVWQDAQQDPEVEELFEVESCCPAEASAVVTRGQVNLAAGLGANEGAPGSVGGAAALAPVMRAAVAKSKAKPSPQSSKKSAEESKAADEELWRKVRVAEAVSRLPKVEAQCSTLNQRSCYSAQQLNSQVQNKRRAREKALLVENEKHLRGSAEAQPLAPPVKRAKKVAAAEPGRVLDTVAEFWERKKARLAAKSSSSSASNVHEVEG